MLSTIRRGVVRATAAGLLLAAVLGLPAALVTFVGWPLPHSFPTAEDWSRWLTSPLGDGAVLDLLAVSAWLLWAAFVPAVVAEALTARRGLRGLPTSPTVTVKRVNPFRFAAATLITAVIAGSLSIAAADTYTAPARTAAVTLTAAGDAARGPARGTATFHVGASSYTYVVSRGDTLSEVSGTWLGDSSRWPEICGLNWHRHWPGVGGSLTDCDLIYPGWELRLPADAVPPAGSKPVTVAGPTASTDSGAPAASASSTASPTDGVATPPAAATTAPTPSPEPTTNGITRPTTEQQPTAEPTQQEPSAPADRPGVVLPGGYVPWSLASALAAAVALVWLQRRRRHVPSEDDENLGDDPLDLPPPLLTVHREVARNPALPALPQLADRAGTVPAQVHLPPGGVGLTGPGADSAVRGAITTALSTGGPRDPDQRGEVVIDAATLTTLLGTDATDLTPWPRLHVVDDLDHALAVVEEMLLNRARLLDDHALTDLPALRTHSPAEEPLPPVLLVTNAPPAGARMRMKTALSLGADVEVTAALLGEWAHGQTLHIGTDGQITGERSTGTFGLPDRLAVLDAATALELLAALREAQTGDRVHLPQPTPPDVEPLPSEPAAVPSTEAGRDAYEAEDDAGASAPDDETTPSAWSGRKARIRLLGTPTVLDVTEPGKPLRSKAAEVAAFLACHPGGADTRTIGENLEPGVRLRSADVRVHTNVHNLRHVLGRAAGPLRLGYVVKSAGRYRLDPTTVEVDLWEFRELLAAARTADGPQRVDLLRQACDLYTAPLAEACDYEWIEPHREKARQQAIDAHTLLADALLPSNPQEAAAVLDRAIGHDPYNENLYRHAMCARHALGDHDAVRALLQSLTVALADLDAEPDEATIELARQLRGRPAAPPTSRQHGTSARGTPSLSGGGPAARTPRRE